ncbi:MAG: hypothetical protein AAF267_21795 [Deinococcota bacterium]
MTTFNESNPTSALLRGTTTPRALQQATRDTTAASTNMTMFSLTSFSVDTYDQTQYLNCEAAQIESQKLVTRLLHEQTTLQTWLNARELHFEDTNVMCFDEQGEFDHAVCTLRLNSLSASSFFSQTYFYNVDKLITVTTQKGHVMPRGES